MVLRQKMIKFKKRAEEAARWKANAAQAVRVEDYSLALLRRRQNLPRQRETDPHKIFARQSPRLAEEVDVVVTDIRAVPGAQRRSHEDGRATESAATESMRCGGSKTAAC